MKLLRFLSSESKRPPVADVTLIGETGYSLGVPTHAKLLERWTSQRGIPSEGRTLFDSDVMTRGLEILWCKAFARGRAFGVARGPHGLVALVVRSASTASLTVLEEDAEFVAARAFSHCCVGTILLVVDESRMQRSPASFSDFKEFGARRGVHSLSPARLYHSERIDDAALSFAYLLADAFVVRE